VIRRVVDATGTPTAATPTDNDSNNGHQPLPNGVSLANRMELMLSPIAQQSTVSFSQIN
jgi:hypothetical protein